jgi:isocitrate dehydrogenase
MTKDLALLVGESQEYQTTDEFMNSLAENLQKKLA